MNNIELIQKAKLFEHIIIFGTGVEGECVYKLLIENGLKNRFVYFCDNANMGKQLMGENIECVENSIDNDALYCVTSPFHQETMTNQLLRYGIKEKNIIYAVTNEIQQEVLEIKKKKKQIAHKKIQFEIDLVSHCNLNCKCCSQFSPIAEKEFLDISTMKRDFDRLAGLFSNECERIYLIGGEPLLHPDIVEIMCLARKYFVKGRISVFTNGLLLKSQSAEFWDTCKENNIDIIVTKYPIDVDYDELKQMVEEKGVPFSFFGNSIYYKYMNNLGLDLEGNQDPINSFYNCGESNNCIKLKNGRLYTCTRPAAIYKFNKYFNQNLEVSENDSVDIYKTQSGKEILEKLAHPIPFCRYCKMFGDYRKAVPWGHTEKQINEWL